MLFCSGTPSYLIKGLQKYHVNVTDIEHYKSFTKSYKLGYSNQEVKICMEKLLGIIYDSTQRTISDWIIKEG